MRTTWSSRKDLGGAVLFEPHRRRWAAGCAAQNYLIPTLTTTSSPGHNRFAVVLPIPDSFLPQRPSSDAASGVVSWPATAKAQAAAGWGSVWSALLSPSTMSPPTSKPEIFDRPNPLRRGGSPGRSRRRWWCCR